MKKHLLCLLLSPLSAALAQPVAPVNIQSGAVITLPAGAAPSALAVADYNQDNRPDIAVCQRGLGTVGVYVQSAAGNFPAGPVSTYAVGPGPTGVVAVVLGNGNARAASDLVAISPGGGYYTLLTNNGNGSGTFTPVVNNNNNTFGTSVPATNPQLLATDLDGNGWVDFVYTYDVNTASRGLYRTQLSTPTLIDYRVQDYVTLPYVPSGLALDDFDRDGTTDVVTTNPAGNEFTVVFARRLGTQPDWNGAPFKIRVPSGGVRPVQVTAGDVNRDFLPDLVVAHEGSSEVTLFLNLNNHQFGAQVSYPLSAAPRRVQLTDLNRDGSPELVVLTADGRLQIFQHTGQPGATRYGTPLILPTGSDPVTMQVIDVDGDYVPDIVVGCAGDNTVRVYLNRSVTLAARQAHLLGVDVYPNPATDRVTVRRASTVQGPLTVTLVDGLGRVVRQEGITAPTTSIAVDDVPRGVYVLKLSGEHGLLTQRIVVQ